jgi:pimeloyl-ACP methyl ester carboxylesterase
LVAIAAGLVVSGCALATAVNKTSCPEGFTCILIDAPLDHLDPEDDRTIEVAFATRPATGASLGALVTAVGGPGDSGLAAAEFEPALMDPEILESYDLVYFDQRGLWTFGEAACPNADARYGNAYVELPTEDPARWEALAELNQDYNESCFRETGDSHVLPHLGTEQVARDLELFRQREGYESLVIYGQSYGTSVAQEYAALFPERVDRLVLDGPLDRTRDSIQFTRDQIMGIEHVLDLVFEACDLDELCAADMGRPAAEVYDSLVARLLDEPVTVQFPFGPDDFDEWPVLAEDLGYVAFLSAYHETDRFVFLRALAAAERGDYVPILRLFPGGDLGLSSMVNASVNCLDGSIPGEDPVAEDRQLYQARQETAPEQRWQYEFALQCVEWPGVDNATPPQGPFTGAGIPTLVVASEADPATPYHQALTLLEQLDDGRLLTVNGGSHVMFGRGIACIDDHVTRFILDGDSPTEEICEAPLLDPYLPLIPVDGTIEEVLTAIDNELAYLPELFYWDGYTMIDIGCTGGGRATFTGTDTITDYELADCAFRPGLVVDGGGRWDYEVSNTVMTANIEGDPCTYVLRQSWEELLGSVKASCP